MSEADEIAKLRAHIAALRTEVDRARDELYALSTRYAADHFKVQSTMHAMGTERLRRTSVESQTAVIGQRCSALEKSIAALKDTLAKAGIDPDA